MNGYPTGDDFRALAAALHAVPGLGAAVDQGAAAMRDASTELLDVVRAELAAGDDPNAIAGAALAHVVAVVGQMPRHSRIPFALGLIAQYALRIVGSEAASRSATQHPSTRRGTT